MLDHKTKQVCALKIIRNKKRFNEQGKVEVNLLQTVKTFDPNDKKNVVKMLESFDFRGHLCITFELLNMNLYEFL